MKRRILSVLLACGMLSSLVACGGDKKPAQNGGAVCTFESLYTSSNKDVLQNGEEKIYTVDKNISGKEYVKLELHSNANLLGKFTYQNVENPAQIVEEEFFIEPSSEKIEFKQFFDAFRDNGVGLFKKHLMSITLKNLDERTAEVQLVDVSVANREIPAVDKEIYLEKEGLKVGADLAMGGTLSYLEKTDYNGQTIDEIIDFNNNIYIGVNAKEKAATHLSSSVNLINIHDAGREIQQAYYADIGGSMQEATGENGYDRRWSYTATREGYYWPYNPVQGGDEVCNLSQIIDYEQTDDCIYVKVRAMDWANGKARPEHKGDDYEEVKNGRTTKSYIENRYKIQDGMLYVDNRFVDWNGFTDMENIKSHTMEIPATYIVHPFNTYVCYTGNLPWSLDDKSYDITTNMLGWWDENAHINEHHPEDWFAWVNDEMFGVGLFIPNAGAYISGRNDPTSHAALTNNRTAFESKMAKDYLYNKKAPTSEYTSSYVGNTSYTAPVANVRMKEYVPFSYSYVVAVDYLESMRSLFREIHRSGIINNEGLKAWDY